MSRFPIVRAGLVVVLAGSGAAVAGGAHAADEPYVLTIKDHRFEPATLEVPAGQEFEIIVRNQDDTPEEFESVELDREKIVPAGAEIRIRIDSLSPGEYDYYGEFHADTAIGQIVAK